jgi:hypothetical protein
VALKWGADESHAVEVQRIESGRVYFRNPHGPREEFPGTPIIDEGPPRQLEDAATGVESMSEADFIKALVGAVVPSSVFQDPAIFPTLCLSETGRELLSAHIRTRELPDLLNKAQAISEQLTPEERRSYRSLVKEPESEISGSIAALIGLHLAAKDIATVEYRAELVQLASSQTKWSFEAIKLLADHSSEVAKDLLEVGTAAARQGNRGAFQQVLYSLTSIDSHSGVNHKNLLLQGLSSPSGATRLVALEALANRAPFYGEILDGLKYTFGPRLWSGPVDKVVPQSSVFSWRLREFAWRFRRMLPI